jgi:hypothetical protein
MDFTSQTATKPDAPLYKLLAGEPFNVFDFTVAPSQTLVVGQVVGFNTATGQIVARDAGPIASDARNGNASTTTFDLDVAAVDPDTVRVTVGGAANYDWTISPGTGTGGVDQIIFATAPATGTGNVVIRYFQSTAKAHGILAEAATTGVGVTAKKPVIVAGPVQLASLVNAPASWKVGMTIGQLILR